MKSKNNEVKITILSVAKATFVVLTGYRLGKLCANFVDRVMNAGIKYGLDRLDKKTPENVHFECKEEEGESDS